ncbi:hypothetical protein GCM10011390_34670 [Aureimonas endophytica]|uniref:Uncharacterized protein n=1 Tax=Aureimonas endophytica TaxID=2027858 RepID=A0A916ZSX1_9HYPH|nr:hypothetical protein [Aureimonas endophytica]GGE12587.1 hypothetical protein GCM10011390_34670 [Aureimonas endophytica]
MRYVVLRSDLEDGVEMFGTVLPADYASLEAARAAAGQMARAHFRHGHDPDRDAWWAADILGREATYRAMEASDPGEARAPVAKASRFANDDRAAA